MNPDKIRVSIGSASKMSLKRIKMDVQPTNCHLLTYSANGCQANCSFCPQSRYTFEKLKSQPDSQGFLSRVIWPSYQLKEVLSIFKESFPAFGSNENDFQRVCLQSLNYPGFDEDVNFILKEISRNTKLPISIAIPPVSSEFIRHYKENGAERICFSLDASTENLFDKIKGREINGPYVWNEHLEKLEQATEIFGRGYVTTHLIIGLGESEFEALDFIHKMKQKGINTGLFAFTPIRNTQYENRIKPPKTKYRKIQLGKYLFDTGKKTIYELSFDSKGDLESFGISPGELRTFIEKSIPFQTSGCPGCNRPYYTSSPREEQYNFPNPINKNVKKIIYNELIYYC